MKLIPLTQGQFAKVDDAHFAWLSQWKWKAVWYKYTSSYRANRVVWNKTLKQYECIQMANIVLNPPAGMLVDHINHDTLDNRLENLRPCSKAQNAQNNRKNRMGTSLFKGVAWEPRYSKWRSYIGVGGRHLFLGYFFDESDAARTYDNAAREHFGEFACVNFPRDGEVCALSPREERANV